MTKLEFTFEIDTDKNGVFDGRDLARQFIGTTFALLVPYTHGCPACTDNLFSSIANEVMAQLHEEGQRRGSLRSVFYALGDDEGKSDRMAAHVEDTQDVTAALLGVSSDGHTH